MFDSNLELYSMNKSTVALLCLAISQGSAYAGNWTQTEATINNLRVYAGQTVFGDLSGGSTLLSCGGATFRIDESVPMFTEIVSMLLAAQTTGAKVKLYDINVCTNSTQTQISGVMLKH